MNKHVLAAAALLAFAFPALAAQLEGRVVGVSDGDTVTLLTAERKQFKIRLSGIDAPEKSQPFGNYAKKTLSLRVFDRDVVVDWSKTDRYGRIVGRVEIDGIDANLEQLRAGAAWVYTDYLKELPAADRQRYLDAEQDARSARRGLWVDPHPQPPWEFRRAAREKRN